MLRSTSSGSGDNEIEEEEVFEITDFTNATDWEKFVTQVEEAITDWQLSRYVRYRALDVNELTNGEWETKTSNLSFSNFPFVLTLHRIKQQEDQEKFVEAPDPNEDDFHLPQFAEDFMNLKNDFPARAHCIARWYGLRCFMILSPVNSNGISSVSKCKLLQSSGSIALNNTTCDVPFFVQIQENWRRLYAGCGISSGMQTNFQLVHLKKCPFQYQHLSGLLYVFKSHLHQPSMPSENCEVSARFTYFLSDWGAKGVWPTTAIDPDSVASQFKTISGCLEDPIGQLHMAAVWSSVTGDMLTDDDIHSDFDPLKAPDWSIRLCYTDDVQSLLNCYLQELINIADRPETIAQLVVQHKQSLPPENDMGQALEKITDPLGKSAIPLVSAKLASGISQVVSDPQGFLKKGAYRLGRIAIASTASQTISDETLEAAMTFIFCGSVECEEKPSTFLLHHKLKAAPITSVTHRLAICTMVVNLCHGGIRALAQMWHAFVTELRRLLDTSEILPGMSKGVPDLRTCLFHQKLQMLNYCICCKINRENMRSHFEKASSLNEGITEMAQEKVESTPPRAIQNGDAHFIEREPEKGETELSTNTSEIQEAQNKLENVDPDANEACVEITDPVERNSETEEEMRVDDDSTEIQPIENENIRVVSDSFQPGEVLANKEKEEEEVTSRVSVVLSEDDSGDEFFECESSIGDEDEEKMIPEDPTESLEQMQMETEIFTEKIIDEIKSLDSTVDLGDESGEEDQHPKEDDQHPREKGQRLGEEEEPLNDKIEHPCEEDQCLDEDRYLEEDQISSDDKNGTYGGGDVNKDQVVGDIEFKEKCETKPEEIGTENSTNLAENDEAKPMYSPEGRLKPFGNTKLLRSDETIYVPIMQDHAPLTEDQLEEQASIFSKLGDTKEGSNLRARMQSASLSSDMESFKAANPGCVLEDFVRWYSPRDFENGALSQRMQIPDNLWVTTWKSAKPVPAHRQKRLFNDTKEAEKVLHFLTNLKPSEVTQLLLPVCIHETILNLRSSANTISECLPSLSLLCNQIESKAGQLFHDWRMSASVANQFNPWNKEQKSQVNDVVRQITFAECLIERAKSLQHKFSDLGNLVEVQKFVRSVLEHPEVKLAGGPNGKQGKLVREYFENQQKLLHRNTSEQMSEFVENANPLPKPTGREFILRANTSHPSTSSRKLPQRMYAVLMRNEFRVASAVSSDTIFF